MNLYLKNKISDGARVARASLGGAEFNLTADINSRVCINVTTRSPKKTVFLLHLDHFFQI
jgi:hypothetical protein